MKCDRQQVTGSTQHVTQEEEKNLFLSILLFFCMVLVLLTAHAERFSVSRVWDLFLNLPLCTQEHYPSVPVPVSFSDTYLDPISGKLVAKDTVLENIASFFVLSSTFEIYFINKI